MSHPATDPFDDLLTLEDTLYTSAYQLGARDGSRAGRIEGRIFGLEKGFEKFASLSQLHGQAVVWGSRLASPSSPLEIKSSTSSPNKDGDGNGNDHALPKLKSNERLTRHINTLHGLTDPPTFSPLNTEEAVADYDDRFKRATAKVKLIERIVDEPFTADPASTFTSNSPAVAVVVGGRNGKEGKEVKRPNQTIRLAKNKVSSKNKSNDDGFEDFQGARFLS